MSLLSGNAFLWGEVFREGGVQKTNIKKKNKNLPFGATISELNNALKKSNIDISCTKTNTKSKMIRIPCVHGKPLAGNPLICDNTVPPKSKITLESWEIISRILSPKEQLSLLSLCIKTDLLAPGVVIGNTLKYWSHSLQFACILATIGQFLPTLDKKDDMTFEARWNPVIGGTHRSSFVKLSDAMPDACRALDEKKATKSPDTNKQSVLNIFLSSTLDHLVRTRKEEEINNRKHTNLESMHDKWIHALCSDNALLLGKRENLQKLHEEIKSWKHPLTVESASPVRLCLRIEEPEEDNKDWIVRFLAQSHDDPSLLLPLEDVWDPKGKRRTLIEKINLPKVRECLLSSLGQASGICPRIEESLRGSVPSTYILDATGALDFLSQKALLLQQAGFGIILPSWWTQNTKKSLALSAKVQTPSMKGKSTLSLGEIVTIDWKIVLDEKNIDENELAALAALKQPLVNYRGQWVHLHPETLERALAFLRKKKKEKYTAHDVLRMALSGEQEGNEIPIQTVEATGWMKSLLKKLSEKSTLDACRQPKGFKGTLRPYQKRGLSWLHYITQWGLGVCLADDMGLGKTIQTLALIQKEWEENPKNRKVSILVCPTSVLGNWRKEAMNFTPDLPILLHHGPQRKKGNIFTKAVKNHAIVITSYALLHRDRAFLEEISWNSIILDEAQNIKNPLTKQSKAARAFHGNKKIALTGTPVENHIGDLWSIMEFCNPGFLGTEKEFREKFFMPIQIFRDEKTAKRLQKLTQPFILRRMKTDKTIIHDLPDKNEMKVYCSLTKEQASLYASVIGKIDESLEKSEGIDRKGRIFSILTQLKQICNHPTHFLGDNSPLPDRSGKLARFESMITELLDEGDHALIFTQYTKMGNLLQMHLQEQFGKEVLFLHGGISRKKRDAMVERFQKGDDPPHLFILSLKAGGSGLNLTRANHVFHFDRWWNPAVENQATDRAFRIGQKRNVHVHKFICSGTLEEKIDNMIEEKKNVAGSIVGTGEGWLTKLSNNDLKEVFALRKEEAVM